MLTRRIIALLCFAGLLIAQPVAASEDLPEDWQFFAWQATGLVGYQVHFLDDEHARVFAGYRIISQDYETGSGTNKLAWDIDLKGPVIGLAYHF